MSIGMINIQFIVCGEDDVYVIEVNPRSQPYRTVHQQGDGHSDRAAGDTGDHRKEDKRSGIYTGNCSTEADYVAVKMTGISPLRRSEAQISASDLR